MSEKLKLRYYIEFSELVDKDAIINMNEKEAEKFKKATEEYFFKLLQTRTELVTELSVEDFKVEFDVEET